jgi:hypothetical protein
LNLGGDETRPSRDEDFHGLKPLIPDKDPVKPLHRGKLILF